MSASSNTLRIDLSVQRAIRVDAFYDWAARLAELEMTVGHGIFSAGTMRTFCAHTGVLLR
jgi:hypothetical protein